MRRRYFVASRSDWEHVAAATADFHDAVIREVGLLGEEYLDRDYILRMDAEPGAAVRVLAHIQRRDVPAAVLRFLGVSRFAYDREMVADPARCSVGRDGLLRFEVASIVVEARSCQVTLLDATALGEAIRLVDLDLGNSD
jgi:hypothetical protein